MKKLIFLLFLFFNSIANFAQQQNANWYFGYHAHVRFTSTGTISQPTGENMPVNNGFDNTYIEGCAAISDYTTGALKFYSNGYTIYGANHQPIANGTQLLGNPSSTQNIVFLPKPKDNNTFYTFSIDGASGLQGGVYYSEINATATPTVTANKNIPLKDHLGINLDGSYYNPANMFNQDNLIDSESITTARHSNGVDYWVIVHANNFIYTYLVDCNGVNIMPSKTYSLAVSNPNMADVALADVMKIEQSNQTVVKIAAVIGYDNSNSDNNRILTGTFDRSTGVIVFNNLVSNSRGSYSLEFSKDGQVLYYNNFDKIMRYQFSTNQTNTLTTGLATFNSNNPNNPVIGIFGMQMAPNDVIYVSVNDNRFLGSITDSNNFTGSVYANNATGNLLPSITGNFTRVSVGLPQLVQWQAPLPPVTLVANNDAFSLSNAATVTTSATVLQANPTNVDTMNGNPAVLSGTPNLVVTPVGSLSPTPASGNITLNANGTITVLGGTTPGTYTLQYQLCTAGSCPVCSNTATVTVVVTSFNPGLGPDRSVLSISLQSDKKIIIGGTFMHYNNTQKYGLARLNSDLSLDTTFGTTGFDSWQNGISFVRATPVQVIGGEERILVGGSNLPGYEGSLLTGPLLRLLPNGSRDTSFTTPLITNNGIHSATINAIIIDSNNKIIIGGNFKIDDGINVRQNIARLNSDGSIDSTFNSSYIDGYYEKLAFQNGKIISSIYLNDQSGSASLVRLNVNGSIDSTFNSNTTVLDNSSAAYIKGLAVNPINNKIVIVGFFDKFGGITVSSIAQLDVNGYLDSTFNSGSGFVNTVTTPAHPISSEKHGETVDFLPNGNSFYVGGGFSAYNGNTINGICRINTTGQLDTSFSPGLGPIGSGSDLDNIGWVLSSKLQPDGKLLIGGVFYKYNGVDRRYLTRLVPQIAGAQGKNATESPIKEEITSTLNFKIYPNPTAGIFNIDLGAFNSEQFDVKIYNLFGQQVLSQKLLKNNGNQLNIGALQNGNYFVVLSNEKRVIKKMIIKQ